MKTLFTLATLAFVAVFGIPSGAQADDMMKDAMMKDAMMTKSTVVAFHSDNCGKCKVLGPKLMEAVGQAGDSVDLVKFDYTNKETIEASKSLAAEKGLVDLQKKYGAKTGFAVVVNADGSEGEKIKYDLSVEEISDLLKS